MMDEQIVDLLRDQFATMNHKIDSLHADVRDHVEKDERYWKKIDTQDGQISMLKWIFGGSGIFAAISAWFWNRVQ